MDTYITDSVLNLDPAVSLYGIDLKVFVFLQSLSDLSLLVIVSMRLNLVWLLNWRFFWVKWQHVDIVFGSNKYGYLIWLFRDMLNDVSSLPIFCILHKVHSIRYIKYLPLQLKLWSNVCLLTRLWLNKFLNLRCLSNQTVFTHD